MNTMLNAGPAHGPLLHTGGDGTLRTAPTIADAIEIEEVPPCRTPSSP